MYQVPTVIKGGISVDDRGTVSYVNEMSFERIKRRYVVTNHESGFIRAWHGHKLEEKFVTVLNGSALIGTVNLDNNVVQKFVLSSIQPAVLYIPANYANGFKTLKPDTILEFFSTSTLEESLYDDTRFPYNKWDIWNEDYR